MNNQKVLKLVDETYDSFQTIKKNFHGSERIKTNEKEEKYYRAKFRELGVDPSIVSKIYHEVVLSGNKRGLEGIKKNITN